MNCYEMCEEERLVLQEIVAEVQEQVHSAHISSPYISAVELMAKSRQHIFESRYFDSETVRKREITNTWLTPTERSVLELLGQGQTSKGISNQLDIPSPRTVDTHRRSLMKKLNVKRVTELITWALAMKPTSFFRKTSTISGVCGGGVE